MLALVRRIDALPYQRPSLGAFFARLGQREAPAGPAGFGLLLGLPCGGGRVVADCEHALLALALPDQLEAVAPRLHPVGLDFQVQPLNVGELVRLVLGLGVTAFGKGQHGGSSLWGSCSVFKTGRGRVVPGIVPGFV
jgi:hypothetical protein